MNLFTKQKQTHRHRKKKLMVTKGERQGRNDKLELWNEQIHTIIYKIDKQGPTIQHRKLYLIYYNSLLRDRI